MSLVIAAIPKEDDPVWEISSEKVPHLTILYLGDSDRANVITAFVEHATNLALNRFGLDVDRRGVLGPDEADVLFFQDSWELPRVQQFRDLLLKEPNIKTAYDSVAQYGAVQEWTPHLMLGYPTAPAKKTDNAIYWVQFDRIAVWSGAYSGPEFILKRPDYPMEVAMSDTSAQGRQFLAHRGVLGMRWGHRKSETTSVSSKSGTTVTGKAKVKTSGGENHPPHPDAIKAAEHKRKLVKSGMAALSNKELQDLQSRMQLESNVSRLHGETSGTGKKFVAKMMTNAAQRGLQTMANQTVDQALKNATDKSRANRAKSAELNKKFKKPK